MLRSVSAGKSSSKWLDRLRSSKGFPSGDDLNLEQFLTHQNLNLPNSFQTKPETTSADEPKLNSDSNQPENEPVQVSEAQNQNEDKKVFNTMSNVLAELFVIGDSSNVPAKKGSRKQLNPRIFSNDNHSVEYVVSNAERAASLMSDGDSRAEVKVLNDQEKEIVYKQNLSGDEEEEEEERDLSLSGFSRTEVTVIDTSCVSWKFEKLLFRKKNVWKVREKRSKTTNLGKKKKQKASDEVEDVGKAKKQKVKVSDGECGSSKEGNGGERESPLVYEEAYHKDERSEELARRTSNNVSKVPKRKHSDLKSGKGIILIKSIPPSKKNGSSTSRSCMKPIPKRHKV